MRKLLISAVLQSMMARSDLKYLLSSWIVVRFRERLSVFAEFVALSEKASNRIQVEFFQILFFKRKFESPNELNVNCGDVMECLLYLFVCDSVPLFLIMKSIRSGTKTSLKKQGSQGLDFLVLCRYFVLSTTPTGAN
jgi:hypothetical protein